MLTRLIVGLVFMKITGRAARCLTAHAYSAGAAAAYASSPRTEESPCHGA
jgi:hypothetical protein